MQISIAHSQSNKNLILFAIILTIGILGSIMFSVFPTSKIIDVPVTIPIDYATDDCVNTKVENNLIVLFRGVHALHPDIQNAKLGIATPIGGHDNPIRHNAGDNNSIFTSWTTNIWVANSFAQRKGAGGIILTKQFHISQIIPSTDKFHQGEWLVAGIVKGAIPISTFVE